MSRRKQAKPQFVHLEPPLHLDNADFHTNNAISQACDVHVCENCCAEFLSISELHEHQMGCFKNPLVLIVSENASLTSLSLAFDSFTHSPEDQTNNSSNTEDPNELYDKILKDNKKWSPDKEINIDCTLTPDHSTVLPQPDFSPELSSTSSNVVIEDLESTKVAVAQFSQDVCLNAVINSNTLTHCKMTIMSLIEQLVAVQQQQVQQLKLIEQIRQNILLLSAQNTDTSAPSNSCEETSEISQTGLLIRHSSHLSQQLVKAAELAQSLVSQPAGVNKVKQQFKHAVYSSNPGSTVMADTDRSKLAMYPSEKQSDDDISGTSHSPSPEVASSTPNLSLPHSPTENYIFEHSLSSIGEIVADLNALTALAQQKKGKLTNINSFGDKRAFDEAASVGASCLTTAELQQHWRAVKDEIKSVKLLFQIPSTRTIENTTSRYVVYQIIVIRSGSYDCKHVAIERRYSEFLHLHHELLHDFSEELEDVSLPKKRLMGNFSEENINERRVTLSELKTAYDLLRGGRYSQALEVLQTVLVLQEKLCSHSSSLLVPTLCAMLVCHRDLEDIHEAFQTGNTALPAVRRYGLCRYRSPLLEAMVDLG
ncbi:Sorting nexin-20 [Bagarius yarrelli]|uniref:Sorting nexin-20 n=1 Tax=Bagarius yarrelli TaxID=175774 RepID=A0A556U419_BAGYA|nr:Sorting nexin-20 [Bagarius yarrelli]